MGLKIERKKMDDDTCDTPIDEKEYIAGVRVIDIGDFRVSRGMSRRNVSSCPHNRVVYDERERRIWCKDCERNVESFDAFLNLVKYFVKKDNAIKCREFELDALEGFALRSIAAKKIDEAWRKKNTVPCCPHCSQALLPEDIKKGFMVMGKNYVKALRENKK